MRLRYTLAFVSLLLAISQLIASAQYIPPVPPEPITIRKTDVSISLVEPRREFIIDVAKLDPEQVVKKISLFLREPVTTVSFITYHLKEPPSGIPNPPDVPLVFFTIRAEAKALENVEKAIITFAVSRTTIEKKRVDKGTIALYRFEGEWKKLPTKKVAEDAELLFEAESPGLSHFASTGAKLPPPFPWWIVVVIVLAIIALIVIALKKKWIKRVAV